MLLQLDNVHFQYQASNGKTNFSLTDINFDVSEGEFITVIGPNGSGKSTLLKILAGLISSDEGTVRLRGKNLSKYKPKELARQIGFVPQNTLSIFPFSVYEIVMMGRTPHLNFMGFENKQDEEVVKEALNYVGIYNLRKKSINEVSGGEAQRAFIARALVQQPSLILLDEPNAHLDVKHQISLFDLLKNFNFEKQLTIVAVSHDLNLTGQYGERLILMEDGKISGDDDIKNILTRENIYKVFGVHSIVEIDNHSNRVSVTIKPH